MGNCQVCYNCEKGVANFVTAEMFLKAQKEGTVPKEWFAGQKAGIPHITYFLFLTNDCNLRCSYCYAVKNPVIMSEDILAQLKIFLTQMEDLRAGKHTSQLHFFGGEPTVKWDILEKFVREFTDTYEKLYGVLPKWSMTTNGTLLNEERLQFMQKYGIVPLLSLDGRKETHNTHRKFIDGRGSFDSIPLDLILKYFPKLEVRPTITPETVDDWDKDLLWLYSKGISMVATEVAYEADWTEERLDAARKMFERLVKVYVDRKKNNQPVWLKFIDDGRMCLGSVKQAGFVCGIARNSLAIDAAGEVYPCQRYASFSNTATRLGNIWKGLDERMLAETQSLKREDMFPEEGFDCANCVARWRCRGGCNAMNFQCLGNRKMILANYCKFTKMWAELSLSALAQTGELWGKKNG